MGGESHAVFILAAYVAAGLVIAVLILRAIVDHRVQSQALRALETSDEGLRLSEERRR